MKGYCLVITTAPDAAVAETLAEGLLHERLAACIHMQDIHSRYLWENKLCREQETVLWIKTLEERYDSVEKYILDHHPYDLPEIIRIPITKGLPAYLKWLADTAGGSGSSQKTL